MSLETESKGGQALNCENNSHVFGRVKKYYLEGTNYLVEMECTRCSESYTRLMSLLEIIEFRRKSGKGIRC